MITVKCRATLPFPLDDIWNVLTDFRQDLWRSDVARVENLEPGRSFLTYTKSGLATRFCVTECIPQWLYVLRMENKAMRGRQTWTLSQAKAGVRVALREEAIPNHPATAAAAALFLRRRQQRCLHDLRRTLDHKKEDVQWTGRT